MRYEERQMNGHHQPSFDLVGILLDIKHSIGGVEAGLERTHEQLTTGLHRVHERIDVVHERMDTHLVTPKPERRGWTESLGLSVKELAGLILLALAGLYGTLTPEHITAWLSH